MQRTVIIDGDFMLMMCYGALNGEINKKAKAAGKVAERPFFAKRAPEESDRSFELRRIKDRGDFIKLLCRHLSGIADRYGMCSDLVIVKDSKSWRKSVEVVKSINYTPSGLSDAIEDEESYKASRAGKKDKNVEWTAVHATFDEFAAVMESKFNVPFVKAAGAEGDDLLWFIPRYLFKKHKTHSLLYYTDGDVTATLEDFIIGARQIKTTASPMGEILSTPKFAQLSNPNVSIFDVDPTRLDHINKLFENVGRGTTHLVPNPAYMIFWKAISGDQKDDVPSVVGWTTTGFRVSRPTQKMLEPVFAKHGIVMSELILPGQNNLTLEHLSNQEFLDDVFDAIEAVMAAAMNSSWDKAIKAIKKDKELSAEEKELKTAAITALKDPKLDRVRLRKVYDSNIRLKHLCKDNIPPHVFESMRAAMEEKAEIIGKCDMVKMTSAGSLINSFDSGQNVNVNSFFDMFDMANP